MILFHDRSVFSSHLHPRIHGFPVANIHFRSHQCHHIPLLKNISLFMQLPLFAYRHPMWFYCPYNDPCELSFEVLSFIRSHKRTLWVHKRVIKAWDLYPEVVQRWVSYLRKNAMPVGTKYYDMGRSTTWNWSCGPRWIGYDGKNLMVEAPSSIKALG